MNKITLIGNLTRDPELRTTPSGVTMCSFSIAVNRRFQQNGEDVTDFFRITVWRQLAEICNKYLTKGKKVAVIGELQARTYEDKEGNTRMSLDVSADEVEFLSPRQSSDDYQANEQRYTPKSAGASNSAKKQNESSGFIDVGDDDLPF